MIMTKLNLKKGDLVKLLSGKDKGKEGKVIKTFPKDQKVVVEGLNIHYRFARPRRAGEKGQRLEIPAAVTISKIMLVCPHCGKPTRISHERSNERNFRKCKKCGKLIN
ncbi:MAG: 50S ribosomal protein L24 [Candidatus Doudnabacteria bacterium]|nr:50S ribosomal protein L24 [Candidatus Doudnabacteria bacterium]